MIVIISIILFDLLHFTIIQVETLSFFIGDGAGDVAVDAIEVAG